MLETGSCALRAALSSVPPLATRSPQERIDTAMLKQTTLAPTARPAYKTAFPFGFWTAVLTTVMTVIAFALAVTTLPISGPFCLANCVVYPYANVAAYVPHDYNWMYPATLATALFLVLAACIHHNAAANSKLYSQIGLCFAVIATAVLSIDYYIQLAMVQPSLLKGEQEGLALISQYNPHGIFIALEELGYLMMSLAFLFMGLTFNGASKLERSIRWLLMISAVLAFGTYGVMSLAYGKELEYRFEVAIISINWSTLIAAGVLLSFLFRRPAAKGQAN
jgi:hypothetical protein